MKNGTLEPLDGVCEQGRGPAMMGGIPHVGIPHVGIPLQDSTVPMPSPLRALFYVLALAVLSVAVYICVQTALMIYDFYLIIQWLGGLAQ